MRTVVRGGRVITGTQDYVADILIDDGVIQSIGNVPEANPDTIVEAAGRYVFPGGVDPHTHMEIPFQGAVAGDDFQTGTVAAAVGGTTTIIDFAIQQRGDDMRVSLEEWFGKAEGKAAVDWGFHQMVTDLDGPFLSSLDDEVREGVTSFKLFMAYPGVLMVDDATIFKAMRRSQENGSFIMIHAENGGVIDELVKQAVADGKKDPIYHATTRPSTAEGEATARAIALAEMAEVPVYIVHLSASEALHAVREARDRGVPVYAETCPHYLLLTEEEMRAPGFDGAKYVVTPPLRPEGHGAELWRGIGSGDLQVMSTDHAPFLFRDRVEIAKGDFSKVPTGLPGVETRIPLLHHFGVRGGHISLNRLVELTSTNPAKLFGLYPKKGEIAPGSDGDLVIFDPAKEFTISAETLVTNCDFSPYEGWTVEGWTDTVLLRGDVIVQDGKFVGKPGQGRFLKRGEPQFVD